MNASLPVSSPERPRPARADTSGDADADGADPEPLPESDAEVDPDGPEPDVVHTNAASDGTRAPACAVAVSDEQLAAWMARIADRDERALAALYDATLLRVYGLALRIVRRPAWAEEVAEDTYFQVWRQAARFDASRGRALTWLLSIARSRAIDTLRRESRCAHDSLDSDDAPALEDRITRPADELLAATQGHATVHRALLALSGQPRQLVAMAFFRGLSHEEIAEQTALPLGTVKSQIRRALITLRQVLGEADLHALAA